MEIEARRAFRVRTTLNEVALERSFKHDDLVELFTFGLVYCHYRYAMMGASRGRELILDDGCSQERPRLDIGTVCPPGFGKDCLDLGASA